MDGITLCRKLKQEPMFSALPVILISAKAARADRELGLSAGAVSWLAKPFTFATLLREIQVHWQTSIPAIPMHSAATERVVDPILQAALTQLANPQFGVANWSSSVHLSDRQLRRRVTESTGQSPLVWLREQRLLQVRSLISSGQCATLAEAGAQVGLGNPGYLYRLYRARFGED
jgi:DNA-binding response OmpR family regulator